MKIVNTFFPNLPKTNGGEAHNLAHRRNQGGGCVLIVLLLIVLYYGSYFVLRGARNPNPQMISHRGAHKGQSGQVPENTLASLRNAVDLGADWLEMDVQMTKDGTLVVIHDETVDRTTNGTGRVADLTLAEIRGLDAGNGEKVPTFKEVIDFAKEVELPIIPEAKSPHLYPGLEQKMIQLIVEADYVAHTAIQSFDASALGTIHELNPGIPRCALHGLWDVNLGDPQPGEAGIVAPMAEMVVLYPWMIKQAHAAGHQVFVWFGIIEYPLVLRFILALGADGLMVDDTAALAGVLGR
jgi:glycerophosphoryl diester phosphodiesterase